jgi:phosphate transport system substrate-binding protein
MPLSSKSLRLSAFVFVCAVTFVAIACGSKSGGGAIKLQGAGATFPNPLYQKWIHEFGSANPNMQIDYQSIGSGGGIKQLQAQTVDFGASDAPMTDEEMKGSPGAVVHIPTVLGAVVITYNVAGVSNALRFSPEVIADIFLGKITKWNDARIKADNPDANLPATDIASIHRSEASGTTFVFTIISRKSALNGKTRLVRTSLQNGLAALAAKATKA